MICHLLGYWVIGLPLGYVLCFVVGWRAVGLWTGLCIALILIGVVLLLAWTKKVRALAGSHARVRPVLSATSDFLP
jgi:MATE family multidrug resistance protein